MQPAHIPDREPYRRLLDLWRRGERAALATVVETSGSAPQIAGASALVTEEGLVSGTVGGGPVEAKTIAEAGAALKSGRSRILEFDLAGALADEAGGVCGGRMRLLIDAAPWIHRGEFRRLGRSISGRGRGVLAVFFREKKAAVLRKWFATSRRRSPEGTGVWPRILGEIRSSAGGGKPFFLKKRGGGLYLEPHAPAARLFIAGAGHVGRAVARLGKFLGFEVTVLDDRAELLTAGRIPDADRFVAGEVPGSLARLRLGQDAYVVLVTRGHKHDSAALRVCLRKPTAYLGMIGSGRKVALMAEEFVRKGWATSEEWTRVHAPIGLPIGSKTVEEIAVSIAAELVAVRRRAADSAARPSSERPG
jgi:xanthine dehydrogenase accessory factor